MTAKDLILRQFPQLSPRLQQAARFVVDHPNEVVIESMRSLAQRAGVQPATLVRLAQQLGYSGWPALKEGFTADLGLRTDRYAQRARHLAARGKNANLLPELFATHHRNLDETEAQDATAIPAAARMLQKALTVHVAGFRASHPIAHSLFYGLRLLRDSALLIDNHAGALEFQLRAIGRRDAVVVASFAPHSRESLVVAEHARAAGARVVAITDSRAAPIALAAHQVLLFAARSPSFFPSIVAALAVIEALLEVLVAKGGPAVANRIDRAETQLIESGAYLQAKAAARRRS